jgi:hypothetical protein
VAAASVAAAAVVGADACVADSAGPFHPSRHSAVIIIT